MNIKRALGFSTLLWVFIFVIWSIIIFVPGIKDMMMLQYVMYWILLIPLVLLLAKWYFKQDPPSAKKGLMVGVLSLVVMFVLDAIVTVSLFIAPQQGTNYLSGFKYFYSQWEMWVGFFWILVLMLFAGWEFDKTFTKRESTKVEEKTGEEV